MNKEDPYRDQAERLRKKIDRKQEKGDSGQKSALPPRSRIHQEKRKKNKWRVKYPVIRLLALFFILLPITIFSIYQYISSDKSINTGLNAESEEVDSETVVFATNDEDEVTIEVREEQETEKPEKAEETQEKEAASGQQEKQAPQKSDAEDKGSEPASDKQVNQTASESTDSSKTAETQEELKKEGRVVYHTVKPKETIFRIAMTYYKSQSGIEIIKQANNLPSNEIQTGQVLKIPLEQ
ncbi:LysM peptidoglycan-binding domain-containing protein [Cytobacillus firmus]|uniref:muramidase family protein n=1 Tax=Cytobacillus firmus TaxID=1399 RepID=UPI0036B872C2